MWPKRLSPLGRTVQLAWLTGAAFFLGRYTEGCSATLLQWPGASLVLLLAVMSGAVLLRDFWKKDRPLDEA